MQPAVDEATFVQHQADRLDLTLGDAGGADLQALAADQLARVLAGDDRFVGGQVGIDLGAFLDVDRLGGLDVTLELAQDPDAPLRAQRALELVVAADDRLVGMPGPASGLSEATGTGTTSRIPVAGVALMPVAR